MTAPTVTIIETGIANTASVAAAFRRLGCTVALTDKPRDVERAPLVVLPGVGSFGAGMAKLRACNLTDPLRDRIAADRSTLCICLGLQLLFEASEESPGVKGLAIIPDTITRFPDSARTPQFGWNMVNAQNDCTLIQSGYAYFANSYRATRIPEGWRGAVADHAGPFVAAIEKIGRDASARVLAGQFHPELSGPWGLALLERWVQTAKEPAPC